MQKSDTDMRSEVIAFARKCIGKSTYRRGAQLCDAPQTFNCFRFTQWIWLQVGVELPEHQLVWPGAISITVDDIAVGDLVFVPRLDYTVASDDFGHVGIATAHSTVIHATKWRNNVVEDPLSVFLKRGCLGLRRVPCCRYTM